MRSNIHARETLTILISKHISYEINKINTGSGTKRVKTIPANV